MVAISKSVRQDIIRRAFKGEAYTAISAVKKVPYHEVRRIGREAGVPKRESFNLPQTHKGKKMKSTTKVKRQQGKLTNEERAEIVRLALEPDPEKKLSHKLISKKFNIHEKYVGILVKKAREAGEVTSKSNGTHEDVQPVAASAVEPKKEQSDEPSTDRKTVIISIARRMIMENLRAAIEQSLEAEFKDSGRTESLESLSLVGRVLTKL